MGNVQAVDLGHNQNGAETNDVLKEKVYKTVLFTVPPIDGSNSKGETIVLRQECLDSNRDLIARNQSCSNKNKLYVEQNKKDRELIKLYSVQIAELARELQDKNDTRNENEMNLDIHKRREEELAGKVSSLQSQISRLELLLRERNTQISRQEKQMENEKKREVIVLEETKRQPEITISTSPVTPEAVAPPIIQTVLDATINPILETVSEASQEAAPEAPPIDDDALKQADENVQKEKDRLLKLNNGPTNNGMIMKKNEQKTLSTTPGLVSEQDIKNVKLRKVAPSAAQQKEKPATGLAAILNNVVLRRGVDLNPSNKNTASEAAFVPAKSNERKFVIPRALQPVPIPAVIASNPLTNSNMKQESKFVKDAKGNWVKQNQPEPRVLVGGYFPSANHRYLRHRFIKKNKNLKQRQQIPTYLPYLGGTSMNYQLMMQQNTRFRNSSGLLPLDQEIYH